MAQSMKAAVVHAFGEPLRIEEVPVDRSRRRGRRISVRSRRDQLTSLTSSATPNVGPMAFLDGLFNGVQCRSRKSTIHVPPGHEQMLDDTFEVHGYHLPDAPPPPNPPPPPLKIVRPEPLPNRPDCPPIARPPA
jgi:hypothetical protein